MAKSAGKIGVRVDRRREIAGGGARATRGQSAGNETARGTGTKIPEKGEGKRKIEAQVRTGIGQQVECTCLESFADGTGTLAAKPSTACRR
jgi:hypothetical protein